MNWGGMAMANPERRGLVEKRERKEGETRKDAEVRVMVYAVLWALLVHSFHPVSSLTQSAAQSPDLRARSVLSFTQQRCIAESNID